MEGTKEGSAGKETETRAGVVRDLGSGNSLGIDLEGEEDGDHPAHQEIHEEHSQPPFL